MPVSIFVFVFTPLGLAWMPVFTGMTD